MEFRGIYLFFILLNYSQRSQTQNIRETLKCSVKLLMETDNIVLSLSAGHIVVNNRI